MEQIVNHKGYWCRVVQQGWKVKRWECAATGQREVMIFPRKLYIPLGDIDEPGARVEQIDQSGTLVEAERLERARLAALEAQRRRAKSRCRQRIKSRDLRMLLTGTYKENVVDFDRVREDFKAWERIVRRSLPGFIGVFAFEKQDRGAWHWHMAVRRIPAFILDKGVKVRSFDFLRRAWVRVVGQFEGKDGGTVNVDGHMKGKAVKGGRSAWVKAQSLAKIAGYVSKYLTKDHGEGLAGRNMWGSSKGLDQDRPTVEEWPEDSFSGVLSYAFELPEGHRIVRHFIGHSGDFWCLYTEPGEPEPPPIS